MRQLALTILIGLFLGWECAVLALAAGGVAAWFLPRFGRKVTGTRPDAAFALGVLATGVALTFFRQDLTGWIFKIR